MQLNMTRIHRACAPREGQCVRASVGRKVHRTRCANETTKHGAGEGSGDVDNLKRRNVPNGSGSLVDAVLFRGAELLGIAVGGEVEMKHDSEHSRQDKITTEEATTKIRNLFDQSYFFCGQGNDDDWDVFSTDCEFTDEFSAFRGTTRFRRNVTNFGRLLAQPKCTVTNLSTSGTESKMVEVRATWIFKGTVRGINGLLAASGETLYTLDPSSNRVVRHDERYEPIEGQRTTI